MLLNRKDGREWKATDYPGIERALFRNNETGGRSSFVRLKEGARLVRASSHVPASADCCYTSLTDVTDLAASLFGAENLGAQMQYAANTSIN